MSESTHIGVIGVGYVGLVTAVCMAELGHTVTCRDIVPEKIDRLRDGKVPIYEPGLEELLTQNRDRLRFTTDMDEVVAGSGIVFICVDTPRTYSGDADLRRVEAVIGELPADMGDVILAMKSTVPVGTGRRLQAALRARGLEEVRYASNPEFLREGNAIADFMNPDRVVVGADDASTQDAICRLHGGLQTEFVRTSVETAEMIKYASNAFLSTKISFINEIANVCEETGADVTQVAYGMGLDKRIGPSFLNAGIGFGGSCFPKDVAALKQLAGNTGYHFQLLNAVIEVNELQKRRIVAKVHKHLGESLRGKVVTLLGLAFKPGTDDMREAASLVIAGRLQAEGATVRAHDPVAASAARELLPNVDIRDDAMDALRGSDAAVLVTEWPEYAELDLGEVSGVLRTPVLIDGRNLYDPFAAAAAGLTYEGIGRGEASLLEPVQ